MARIARLLLAATLVAATAVFITAAASGSSQHKQATRVAKVVLDFTQPDHVSFTLQGCRNGGSITFGQNGPFVCADAAYTTGNLGKGWNELDLVPFRLTSTAGNQSSTQTYNVAVAGDYQAGSPNVTGWDVIGGFAVNTAKSDSSCSVSAAPQATGPGLAGGAISSVYRTLTIDQDAGTTCVIDYYQRLALGAHSYPGASLQAYLFQTSDFSGGQKTVPLPVNEIQPQSISKDMTATRDSDTPWNLTKGATPATLNFGNVCDTGYSSTQPVSVTVTWTKLAAVPSGQVLLVTNIYATNPSSRTITTSISDQMYEGTGQSAPLGAPFTASKDVPANTANYLIGTHSQLVTSSATHFNDVATATYTDLVTNIPVPGTTTATAGADVTTGTTLNASATIADSESITGSGLTFKVAAPAVGSFTGGYTAGTYTTGPVGWASGSKTGSGSVTFAKTVKLDPKQVTTGKLSDTAILNGSDGFGPIDAQLEVNISSSATGTLRINKMIADVLSGSESATFTFHVKDASDVEVAAPTITFNAGETSKYVDVTALPMGTYTVSEDAVAGWYPQVSHSADLSLPSRCSNSVSFTNLVPPAHAQVRKVTDPAGYEAGWEMTLNGPGVPAGGEKVTTTGSGYVAFTTDLQEGSYTITETPQAPWVQQPSSGDCSFTVDYPADSGKTFSCTENNKARGTVRLTKTLNGGALGSQPFTFELRQGDQSATSTAALETLIANSGNGGVLDFTTPLVPGTTYALCELLVAGYGPNISGYGPYNPADNPNYWCFNFSIAVADTANTPSISFTVDNSHEFTKALTIGYWKNWSACAKSHGKQSDALGQYLDGITLGVYTFTASHNNECNAVNTLDKRTFSGEKKASDPLFNMAAQLLAADLNVKSGAGSCQLANDAITGGQALLAKYGWDGETYSPELTPEDATAANDFATALDKYNNNNLCP